MKSVIKDNCYDNLNFGKIVHRRDNTNEVHLASPGEGRGHGFLVFMLMVISIILIGP